MLENKFITIDEFSQVTETRKTYTDDVLEVEGQFNLIFDDFIRHLKNCGFSQNLIDTIHIKSR